MALFDVHPWAQFFAGVLLGCWIGAVIAAAGVLLLVGRRVRQLETINLLLRTKVKAGMKPPRTGTSGSGSMLVMPLPRSVHAMDLPAGKVARVN